MSDIILMNHTCSSMTVISNQFIDMYFPIAPSEAIKIYLLLLRYAGASQSITLDMLSKKANETEETVYSSLSYWEQCGLLHLTKDQGQRILSMQLLPLSQQPSPSPKPSLSQHQKEESTSNTFSHSLPEKHSVAPAQMEHHPSAQALSQLVFVTETYFGRPLTHTDTNTLFYIYDSLKFSYELLEYLIEYCAEIDKKNLRYLEKVAIAWYESGITTVEQAKASTKNYNKTYNSIMKSFGLSGRNFGRVEMDFIDKWTNNYGFPLSIILEACDRTLKAIHQPSFQYADRILSDWHKSGAKTMEEITKLDSVHNSTKKQERKTTTVQKTSAPNKFHNFEQRSYDYQALEQRFINKINGINMDKK